ncbi:MAG: hypoxanthine phosphoribosyltransferase [Bacteroidetes bacterium]|nr:MAG: hypoxanthine phosphoribosyltransferase [Bacteroidota bacterium]
MKKVKVRDKEFSLFLTAEDIDKAVEQVAEMINIDMEGRDPLFLCVLNGAFIFASDLLKKVEVNCEISFVKLSSYVGTKTTNTVRELIGLDQVLTNRTVVVIEDIIDTGITMDYTLAKLRKLGASDVRIATLLFKPEAFRKNYPIDYVGIVIPNEFIVGYGLDYDGHGRNLPDIYKIIED